MRGRKRSVANVDSKTKGRETNKQIASKSFQILHQIFSRFKEVEAKSHMMSVNLQCKHAKINSMFLMSMF